MREKEDTCECCGAWTEIGRKKKQEHNKNNPIYGTDFSKPLSQLVEEARAEMSKVRGKLSDIRFAFPVWGEQTEEVEGLLSCGLVTLHYIAEEMRKVEERNKNENRNS